MLQSTNSRNFSRIKRYGNPPQIIETCSFCLLSTPSSVLDSIFKVLKTLNYPLCSSRHVLSDVINQYPQLLSDETLWKYPKANRNPNDILCAVLSFHGMTQIPINHFDHLNALYMLQSINSRNLCWMKRYGNTPNLIYPPAMLCAVFIFQGEKNIWSTIVIISTRSIFCNQPIAAIKVGSSVMTIPPSW